MSLLRFAPALVALALFAGACAENVPDASGRNGEDASTDAAPSSDGELADLTGYELTMEGMDRYAAASLAFARAMQTMTPEERLAFEGPPRQETPTPDEIASRIAFHPATESAVREAGLSPREYALITHTIIYSGMVESRLAGQPGIDRDSLARAVGVNPASVAFLRDNAEELRRRRQALEAEVESVESSE